MMKTPKEIFREVYKGDPNFMTPNVLEYFGNEKLAIELSQGRGIFTPDLFGVTVIENGQKGSDKSECFTERSEAANYIDKLLNN